MVNNILRGMGTDSYETYGGNHFIMYANTKSLCSTPETVLLYINYISIKK